MSRVVWSSQLGIGALIAFSVATLAFVGVGFAGDIEPIEEEADFEAGADEQQEGAAVTQTRAVAVPARRAVATKPDADHVSLAEDAPADTVLALPSNLPKLPANVMPSPTAAPTPQSVEALAMRRGAQMVETVRKAVVSIEQAATEKEAITAFAEFKQAAVRFRTQWKVLDDKLSPSQRQRVTNAITARIVPYEKRMKAAFAKVPAAHRNF